jgi:hypothetical protein
VTDYSKERGQVPPGFCEPRLSLNFDGATLRFQGSGIHLYPAVSGVPVDGRFSYTQAAQKESGKGPIPEGTYWIRPDELWDNAWYHVLARNRAWGNHRITIHPFPSTQTWGRGGFFIHGGVTPGSKGCIDLTLQMDRFVNDLKSELGGLPGCQIHLSVRYT